MTPLDRAHRRSFAAPTATPWHASQSLRLLLCASATLYWELVLIRWISACVRISLLYGSTWTVNLLVFCGILLLILLGNLTCHKLQRPPLKLWFALLVASISAAYFTPTHALLGIDASILRMLCAVLVFLGPVYFASIIFARLIRDERDLYQACGSNVLGAVVGGACEYLSLMMGFKSLLGLTLVFYLAVFLLTHGRRFSCGT